MQSDHQIFFIDHDKDSLQHLFTRLRTSFTNSLTHLLQKEISVTTFKNDLPAIIFVNVNSSDIKKGLSLLKKLTRHTRHITIAVVPPDDEKLTSQVLALNPFYFVKKPYDPDEITYILKRALDKAHLSSKTKKSTCSSQAFCGIIGASPAMEKLFSLITKIAEDDYATVLIRGESGTGKELVAKAIHKKSPRHANRFVPVNCAAIPDELLESELFGYVKGAFTGATQAKQGRIQFAEGGTLFLDEIGDMKSSLQAKLLRVLQEKEFEPVGGVQPIPVNTRILAATHCDLEKLVQAGKFREDLYYRLSVIPLHIPPLCERRDDIPELIHAFIAKYTESRGKKTFSFSREALKSLLQYNWRGNVRELENLIQHMSILYSGEIVKNSDLPEKYTASENHDQVDIAALLSQKNGGEDKDIEDLSPFTIDSLFNENDEVDFNAVINEMETQLILNALRISDGNKKEAARLLHLKRTTLLEKIKKKKLNLTDE